MQLQAEMVLPAVPGDDIPGTQSCLRAASQAFIFSLSVCCTNAEGSAAPDCMFHLGLEEHHPWQLIVEQ